MKCAMHYLMHHRNDLRPDTAHREVDPLRVGTVSARVLQPVGSPLDMSYMPGYQTMINTSASSMYPRPDKLKTLK